MHMTREIEIASLGFLSPPYRYLYNYLMDYTATTLWTMHFKTVKHQLARITNYPVCLRLCCHTIGHVGMGTRLNWMQNYSKKVQYEWVE